MQKNLSVAFITNKELQNKLSDKKPKLSIQGIDKLRKHYVFQDRGTIAVY